MLRQIHIFLESNLVFVKNFAMALGSDELDNVKKIIQKYIDMPIIGKTFQRNLTDFQIFHRASDKLFFLFITDLVDSIQYIDEMIIKTIEKFKQLFPDPLKVSEPSRETGELNEFLSQLQKDLHSKIAIIGPTGAGKTTLYEMLKSGKERIHMDFAKTSILEIDHVCFDIWDFQLNDNFSLLWSKFIRGSDLVIFLFNLANYNLKMINHFMKLHLIEGKNSKLLMIGNKRDLIEDTDMKLIKNELGFSDFEEISLRDADAKSKIEQFIMTVLNLRKKLPTEFIELVKKTDNLVLEGKKIEALANYKELLNTSKSYQNVKYTKTLEQKIENLTKKIQEEMDKRKKVVKEKDFELAKPLVFTRKVTVKALPDSEALDQLLEIESIPEEETVSPSKSMKELVSFQKFDTEKEIIPPITQKSELKIIKPISVSKKEKKESKPETEMPMELFGPHKELEQDIKKPLVVDFTKELQKIIIQKGSSLSLELCDNLITELEKSLGRDITIDDIKLAADFFVKQEKMSQ
ncbi:MAG: ADP-ribosylation factor-like protein [Promethearchaeota archaeon]